MYEKRLSFQHQRFAGRTIRLNINQIKAQKCERKCKENQKEKRFHQKQLKETKKPTKTTLVGIQLALKKNFSIRTHLRICYNLISVRCRLILFMWHFRWFFICFLTRGEQLPPTPAEALKIANVGQKCNWIRDFPLRYRRMMSASKQRFFFLRINFHFKAFFIIVFLLGSSFVRIGRDWRYRLWWKASF